jgi:ATP-dependent Clp protease protease subunit
MKEVMNGIMSDATGQPIDKIARDTERDYILEAPAAIEYGIVDRIISSRERQSK